MPLRGLVHFDAFGAFWPDSLVHFGSRIQVQSLFKMPAANRVKEVVRAARYTGPNISQTCKWVRLYIVTAQQQSKPQQKSKPQQQNNQNCSWVETN